MTGKIKNSNVLPICHIIPLDCQVRVYVHVYVQLTRALTDTNKIAYRQYTGNAKRYNRQKPMARRLALIVLLPMQSSWKMVWKA
jgi:hypothetical protein